MFCQSATLLLGHVGPAVCVCLFLRLAEHMKRAIRCLFGCRRCRAEQKLMHKHTEVHARNCRHTDKHHMWKHNLASRSSRKHTRSTFASVIVTVCVSPGRGSVLPLPSCWLFGLQASVDESRAARHSGAVRPRGTRLAFLLSSWLAATVSVLALADLTSRQLFILIVQTPYHKLKLHFFLLPSCKSFLIGVFFSFLIR